MRHVQVQRASARDEPINLRRESTLSIVSQSVIRSFVRRVRSFVARAPGARACRRFRDDSPETRSIDRSIDRLSRASHDRSTRSRSTTRRYIFLSSIHPFLARASPSPPLARVARARSNAPARDSASRRDDDRTRPPSLVAPDSAWRASFERVKKNTAIFLAIVVRSSTARRASSSGVRSVGSVESNRIESRRGVDSSRVVLILES